MQNPPKKSQLSTAKLRSSPQVKHKSIRKRKEIIRRAATGKTVRDEEEGITMTVEDQNKRRPYKPVMEKFVAALAAKQIEGLKAEFKELQTFKPADVTSIAFAANRDKNRYTNVPCYDKTRVVLTYGVPPNTDYIHANWVDSSFVKLTNKYICAQGPIEATPTMPGTVNDFWRMIWQEKVKFIVMLCNTVEQGRVKCAQYYPLFVGETKVYGNVTVTNKRNTTSLKEKVFETIILDARVSGSPDVLEITLIRWLEWQDFSVPPSLLAMLRILRFIRDQPNTTALIHCSAGIGRSGTLMACEICLRILLEGKELNVLNVVREIRTKRAGAIQTESQYIYLHRALLEYIQAKKIMKNELSKFAAAYTEYVKSLGKPTIDHAKGTDHAKATDNATPNTAKATMDPNSSPVPVARSAYTGNASHYLPHIR